MNDDRLNTAIAEFLEAEDAGRAPDPRQFIVEHADVAVELEAYFANRDEFDSLAEPLAPIKATSRSGWTHRSSDSREAPRGNGVMCSIRDQEVDDPGHRFGDYELIRQIARGGMGVVYEARQISLDRIVALKMIAAGPLALAADLERFRTEAKAAAHLDHPNIVPIYEVGERDGQPYFTMKFVEGESLAERLARGPLAPRDAAALVGTIARAVHYAHQHGVLHRDLKPGNVLLEAAEGKEQRAEGLTKTQNGDHSEVIDAHRLALRPPPSALRPFITDFGLAKCLDTASDLTRSGAVLGTPTYMAPEQATGKRHAITTAADVYSLGAIFYAMLTGRPPFRAETPLETLRQVVEDEPAPPSRIATRIDRDLETICLKCLEKDPSRRYGSAESLGDDLDRWLDHRPILARRTGFAERALKWARRHPAAAGLAAVVLLAAMFAVAGTVWHGRQLAAEVRRTELQRQQAERHFHEARDAVDRMSELAEKELAAAPQMEEVRRALLVEALRFHERFFEVRGADPAVRRDTARAFERAGDIHFKLGDLGGAERATRRAIELLRQLATDRPDDAAAPLDLARCHRTLSDVLGVAGRFHDAEQASRDAIRLVDALGRADAESRRELARGYRQLGNMLILAAQWREAGESLNQALDIQQQLGDEHAENSEFARDLASCYFAVGTFYKERVNRSKSEAAFLRAIEIQSRLATEFPREPAYRLDQAASFDGLGLLLRRVPRRDEAEAALRRALELRAAVATDFPAAPLHRQNVGASHNNLAMFLADDPDRLAEAEASYRAAVTQFEKLNVDFPEVPRVRSNLGNSLNGLAEVLGRQGRLADARDCLNSAQPHLEAAFSATPQSGPFLSRLREHWKVREEICRQLGNDAEAERAAAEFRSMDQLLQSLPSRDH